MKVLHLFGDWKWTGPAEPTLDLCLELRALGADVALACQKAPPEASGSLPARARERGLEPDFAFALNRSFNIRDNLADIGAIRDRCERGDVNIVHVHFTHDHVIGSMGLRPPARLVRTNHRGTALPWLLRKRMDGYLTFSSVDFERAKLAASKRLIAPGMRLERFDPSRSYQDMRAHFSIARDAFVLGVVARMQKHRRFDALLEGVRLARARVPELRVVVVGRGTHMESVAVEPAKRLGLEQTVLFTGYLSGPYLGSEAPDVRDTYVATLATFDALLFLVPGSDGTCRALREAMAMGKAVIGAQRGMIPEIVDEGRTGLVIDDTPENIAAAIAHLARDRTRCAEMGRRGREKALAQYDIRKQAREVLDFYKEVLAR